MNSIKVISIVLVKSAFQICTYFFAQQVFDGGDSNACLKNRRQNSCR